MLKNYFKIAVRSLLKRKGYTLINVLGLATGMAVCLLIVLFIESELNYDNFEKNGDTIYRVALDRKYPGRMTSYSMIPSSIGAAIQHEYPEVLQSTRLFNFLGNGNLFVRIGDKVFEERKVFLADSNFFNVFTTKLLKGDTATALQKPNSAILTETTAKRFFGSVEDAMNKSFTADNNAHFIVSGVCKDWPENSHFTFDMLIASSTFPAPTNYINFSAHTYLLLNPNASAAALEAKFP